MKDREKIQKALSGIHASEDLLEEVYSMANHLSSHNRHFVRHVGRIVITAILALALATGAVAYFGLWDWIINVHRDADTEQRGEIAQEVIEQFSDRKMKIQETAEKMDNGIIYHFSVADWEDKEGQALVQMDDTGRITWLDLRELYPYPKPENCRPAYLRTIAQMDFNSLQLMEGTETELFLADHYLSEVVYPDFYGYNDRIQEPARIAINFYHSKGYLDATAEDIAKICFECFNGGCAWVNVLMKNGDIISVFLQPDDMTPLGFLLRTAEELDSNGWRSRYDEEFAAIDNHTLEDYRAEKQSEYAANGVG